MSAKSDDRQQTTPENADSGGHDSGISLSRMRKTLGEIDKRPLKVSILERYVRFCETTHIHGCQPFQRIAVVGWFFRAMYLLFWLCGVTCAAYFITVETRNFIKEVVEISHDYKQATSSDLYFPQVVLCNSNFVQATFLEEYEIEEHADLLVKYYFTGSDEPISEEEEDIIKKIENATLARRVAGALMRFGNTTSVKSLLLMVENKTEEELLSMAKTMPTPLPLIMGLKPGFRSILRATYNKRERDPSFAAPFYPSYRTDLGWCTLLIPMVEFQERFQNVNLQLLRELYAPEIPSGIGIGKIGGLRLLVDAEVYDYSYGSFGDEGFQVGIIPHRDIPLMFLQNTYVTPGSLTNIIVDPVITKTKDDVRERFSADTRKCYFQDEVVTDQAMGIGGHNRHRYSLGNCYWQAAVSHASEVCHCKVWQYGGPSVDLDFCYGQSLTCFKDMLRDFGRIDRFTDNNNQTYMCYSSCNSYSHSVTTNSGRYPNAETFMYDALDFCAILDKMAVSCKNGFKKKRLQDSTFDCSVLDEFPEEVDNCTKLYYAHSDALFKESSVVYIENFRNNDRLKNAVWNYTTENVALINVYFNDINMRRLVRKQSYKWIKFVASLGGHLGLALGMSFITLLEAAYMLVRMCILIFAKCCGKTEEDEDFDWREVEPDVTEKRRTICIDCPCRCCRVDDETAEMVR